MKRNSRVTLEDIAKQLNVSRVTVSKALRDHPDISTETTKLVRKTAKDFGYTPNLLARNLSSRRSQMIGLVIPKVAHAFFGSVIEGVYNTAFDNDYETILTVSQENDERERKHLQTLVSMRVDGILISISETTRDLEVFGWIKKLGVPLIFIDRCPNPLPAGFGSVLVDDEGGAFRAVEHAISIGYRKIACFGGTTNTNIGRNRLRGFKSAMKKHRVPVQPHWIAEGGYGQNVGYDNIMRLHSLRRLPEFVFAMTYPIALGVYSAAKKLGLRIPEDIDLISFGDSDVSDVISPALSCVSQPSYQLGSVAAGLLLKNLSDPETLRNQHIVLPTDLLIRETCTLQKAIVPSRNVRSHLLRS